MTDYYLNQTTELILLMACHCHYFYILSSTSIQFSPKNGIIQRSTRLYNNEEYSVDKLSIVCISCVCHVRSVLHISRMKQAQLRTQKSMHLLMPDHYPISEIKQVNRNLEGLASNFNMYGNRNVFKFLLWQINLPAVRKGVEDSWKGWRPYLDMQRKKLHIVNIYY